MNTEHMELLASEEWREKLVDIIMPNALNGIRLGDDVLEIGPGPGMTTDLLRIELGQLTAAEVDPELAAALADRLAGTNVDVVLADASDLPFDDGRFSDVVSFSMLHHVPTAELQNRVFSEVARVLRPGGQFVAADGCATDDLAALHVDDIYNPIDPAGLTARLAAAGFVDVNVRSDGQRWAVHARTPGTAATGK